ncbi:MAG TPA: DUF2933 domain-containing protein [Chloroflexota bacterium]|nr:DUF2933 domain-containing protein [Chloroflexota bacterium]HUM67456.1 DUF2933 domain-containing protein [Chloroflexota bacterium]
MTRKHLILMMLGCLLPLAALAAIFIFQVEVSTGLLFGLVLLCPAMHLLMMRAHRGHGAHHGAHMTNDSDKSCLITGSRLP